LGEKDEMKEKKSEAEIFAKTLKLRTIFKDLNQLTWGVREAEQKFPIQSHAKDLLFVYQNFITELLTISERAREEK